MDAKILCLGILSKGEATGYEIKKACENGPYAYIHPIGYGSIYPALGHLLEEGCVSCREVLSDSGPGKKVYRITQSGQDMLSSALEAPCAPDRFRSEKLMVLLLGHMVSQERVSQILESYLEEHEKALHMIDNAPEGDIPPGRQFVRAFGRTIHQAAADFLRTRGEDFCRELAVAREENQQGNRS